jgi:hypothetical protein
MNIIINMSIENFGKSSKFVIIGSQTMYIKGITA